MAVFEPHRLLPEHPAAFGGGIVVIYGVALLAGCYLAGVFLGNVLGAALGIDANVGGVGIAMLFLILISDRLIKRGRLKPITRQGVAFWSAMYIPVVVAMAARQDVVAALDGGVMAFTAGALAVVACVLLVPVISRLGGSDEPLPAIGEEDEG